MKSANAEDLAKMASGGRGGPKTGTSFDLLTATLRIERNKIINVS